MYRWPAKYCITPHRHVKIDWSSAHVRKGVHGATTAVAAKTSIQNEVFCDYYMLVMLCTKWAKCSFTRVARTRFLCKRRVWKIYCCGLALSSEPQTWILYGVVCLTTSKKCTRMPAARAARFFFPHSIHWFVTLALALAFLSLASCRRERRLNDHCARRTPQEEQHSLKDTHSRINLPI